LTRRSFLARAGTAGALGGAAFVGARALGAEGSGASAKAGNQHTKDDGWFCYGDRKHEGNVDHAANGFHPHDILYDFDHGAEPKDGSGRTVATRRNSRHVANPKAWCSARLVNAPTASHSP